MDERQAEAMRKAVAESDALQKKKPLKKTRGSSDSGVMKYVELVRTKAVEIWGTTVGKIGICTGIGVILLLILTSIFTSSSEKKQNVVPSYRLTDAAVSVYQSASSSSGYAYDAYIEIENDGTTSFYLNDIMFLVQDSAGNRLALDSDISVFPSIIAPGEKGYLFKFGSAVTEGSFDIGDKVQMQPKFRVVKSDAELHRYPVTDVVIRDGENGKFVSCNVRNDTDKTADMMHAVAVLYDKDGHCLGISTSFLSTVGAQSTTPLVFEPMVVMAGVDVSSIASCVVWVF